MTRVGIVCPLPPCQSGPADWIADAAPQLAESLDLVFLVDDVAGVDPALRATFEVWPVAEVDDPTLDLVVYHIANNPHHEFVHRAAIEGPSGLCELHDATIHHLVHHLYLMSGDGEAYERAGAVSHGDDGRDIVNVRRAFPRGALDLFLYDLLPHVTRRHRGVIAHSDYAARLVELGSPEVPRWVARLHAPAAPPPATKAMSGLAEDRFVIGVFGFVGAPKRPLLLVEALRRAVDAGLDAELLFVGQDDMRGELQAAVRDAALDDRVTVTGFVDEHRLRMYLATVDAVASLRAPHAGETSATLAYALAAGRPTLVQDVGSWSELPGDAVVKVPVDGDEAGALADAFRRVAADPELRARLSEHAQAYAAAQLSPAAYCRSVVGAVHEALATPTSACTALHIQSTLRTRDEDLAWQAGLDSLDARPQRVLVGRAPAWVRAELARRGHDVQLSPDGIRPLRTATLDLVLTAAPPPGPARRAELAAINRALVSGGALLLCTASPRCGGNALIADLHAAGFGARSPRFDGTPPSLWPPPRGTADPATTHVLARKATLPGPA